MKTKFIICLILFVTTLGVYAQNDSFEYKISRDDIPATILDSVKTDFPGYQAVEFEGIPRTYINDEFNEESDGGITDTFKGVLVSLTNKGDQKLASYTMNGTLVNVWESATDNPLSDKAIAKIHADYPQWTIEKVMHSNSGKTGTHRVTLEKAGKVQTLAIDSDGNTLKN